MGSLAEKLVMSGRVVRLLNSDTCRLTSDVVNSFIQVDFRHW